MNLQDAISQRNNLLTGLLRVYFDPNTGCAGEGQETVLLHWPLKLKAVTKDGEEFGAEQHEDQWAFGATIR